MTKTDYIITGVGAAGLILAYRMACDSYFDNKSIIIIYINKSLTNNCTWCFWENGEGEWEELLHKKWPN